MKDTDIHSYHIFMFPFQWKVEEKEKYLFSEQISLKSIHFAKSCFWTHVQKPQSEEDAQVMYNERNYFYEFVHDALYDLPKRDSMLQHFERDEPKNQNVYYNIHVKNLYVDKTYKLLLDALNLNFYSTGVGILSFYLKNTEYENVDDILSINQYGRRVYPPFFADINNRYETAASIKIEGLNSVYQDDFQNYHYEDFNCPASFIGKLITEVATNIKFKPVIDDRMYVMSWYKNNELVKQFHPNTDSIDKQCEKEETENKAFINFIGSDFWYKYIFVDANFPTCQNHEMRKELALKATYKRWQNYGSLYGISRYSCVMLSNAGESEIHLYKTFETMYVRMAELCLVERASVLRFSAEVTDLSNLSKNETLSEKAGSLYKEYIRFVNQIHFREVSAQEQAIEIYGMLYENMDLSRHVEKLDNEIEELYNYIGLNEDRTMNKQMSWMTIVATIFLPATLIASLFGMNPFGDTKSSFALQTIICIVSMCIAILIIAFFKKNINKHK